MNDDFMLNMKYTDALRWVRGIIKVHYL